MSTFSKGEYVIAAAQGYGSRMRGYGSINFAAGDELHITSVSGEYLNVRKPGGLVFRIHRSKVTKQERPLGEIPEGGISPDDPRIQWLFEDAGRMANRLGLCKDYDRMCEALGVPGRVRNFTVKVAVADGIEITAKVQARSKVQAERRIIEQFTQVQPGQLKAIAAPA